jgi:tRNA threonylcarbamoyladenosine biosynthesis protein TsaB
MSVSPPAARAGRFLAFDTSTERLSLALTDGHQVWHEDQAGGAQASITLIPSVLALLARAGMALDALDAIVFGRGPGSFTGLRTACAVAQGLALGAGLPVLPVDTLLAVAEAARQEHLATQPGLQTLQVLALLDARMDEVYSARHAWSADQGWRCVRELRVGPPESLEADLPPGVLLAGNVREVYGPRLPAGLSCQPVWPDARALLRLAPERMARGEAVPPEQAMPLYIRDKVAQTTAERALLQSARAAAPR